MSADPMARAKQLIEEQIPDAQVAVADLTGTGDHVGLTVVSDAFAGMRPLQQHRMIMDILKGEFERGLHAVQIKTMTKAQAEGTE